VRIIFLRFIGALAALLMTSGAHAAVIVTAVETGGNVVFTTADGASLDLTGLSGGSGGDCSASSVRPLEAVIVMGPGGACDAYGGLTAAPSNFGTGGITNASFTTGDTIGVGPLGLGVPVNYVSTAALIAGTSTYPGETFASLGIDPGSYVWSWSGDSITLNVAVPIPATFYLFGSALGLLGWMRRKTS
jgi:hypothetical protein